MASSNQIKLAIIGLGQIGSSIGLALGEQKKSIARVGHDIEPGIAGRSKAMGAVDRTEFNIHSAVSGANLVLLALPMDQVQETLRLIAEDLQDGAVVMDTAPVKEMVVDWVDQVLPEGRYYIGLAPVINPAYLTEPTSGIEAAHADLFQKGLMAIITPLRTCPEAIDLAADLTRLLGATPFFVDTSEIDGLMAATHLLPQLLSAVLLDITTNQPGWREAQKIAGRPFSNMGIPVTQTTPESFSAALTLNSQNMIRFIDNAIDALQNVRQDILEQNRENILKFIKQARENFDFWRINRQKGDWSSAELRSSEPLPTAGDVFGHMIGLRRKPKNK